ncbi:hypothetical protein IAQ61_008478 [Plenodomus lingam]|uniref:uncharacterized protein n=1 Tax=Leptosphaeria maculans TaxID=5022 RepID=UPI003332EB55|nr:hypothetical protein IAQ61_008478 [Plenodomus lingam]
MQRALGCHVKYVCDLIEGEKKLVCDVPRWLGLLVVQADQIRSDQGGRRGACTPAKPITLSSNSNHISSDLALSFLTCREETEETPASIQVGGFQAKPPNSGFGTSPNPIASEDDAKRATWLTPKR